MDRAVSGQSTGARANVVPEQYGGEVSGPREEGRLTKPSLVENTTRIDQWQCQMQDYDRGLQRDDVVCTAAGIAEQRAESAKLHREGCAAL